MTKSRRAATSARTPASARSCREATRQPVLDVRSASGPHPAGKPAAAAPVHSTRLSAGGAFALNTCFVASLLVLSQLSLLEQRPTVRAAIVGAALFLLAWSGLLFGVLRRGQKVAFEIVARRQHYRRWAGVIWRTSACGRLRSAP